jgi:hypothetical protein
MLYYLVVFIAVSLLAIGIILLRKPFFSFAYATSSLLNSMLESNLDEATKQKKHLQSLVNLLSKFSQLIIFITIAFGISILPILLYTQFSHIAIHNLDASSLYFYLSIILGSGFIIVYPFFKKNKSKDYSEWSKLLHRMILDNYNISRSLFSLEKKLFKKKIKNKYNYFVIVTGLARAGTTALTNLLFESNKFHSLSYDNMPFVLSVNLWRKVYHPRKNKLKQRAHGDNIMFGYKTIEALEEHFFKVFLRDKFISEQTLNEHEIDNQTYESYLAYQQLINVNNNNSIYLAKNNNIILRYKSLRKHNPDFKILLIFRYPVAQAFSLLNQHKRFSQLHSEDQFALDYMNWLGHHEFGLNHKPFNLSPINNRKQYDTRSINYWLTLWISYHAKILTLIDDKNLHLIEYADLCNKPNELLSKIGVELNLDLKTEQPKEPYNKESNLPEMNINPKLMEQSEWIYNELTKYKLII